MIREATRADLPRLTQLLARANDAPHDIRVVAEEKLFGSGYTGPTIVRLCDDGLSVVCGKHLRLLAVDRDKRRQGIGTALLRDAEEHGAIVVGAEPGNYFTPGIVSTDIASIAFFRKHGYAETATTQNLIADLPTAEGGGPAVASDRRVEALAFIDRHFGPIWRFEAARAATIFHASVGGAIAGFAAQDANNRGLGFFGPTGVAEPHRGLGLGRQLLLASLAHLRQSGFTRSVIPWTDAIDFYRKSCGAVVAHRFTIMRRIAP